MGVGFVNKDGIDLGDLLVHREFFQTSSVYGWGYNDDGTLGLSDVVRRSQPVAISGQWKKIKNIIADSAEVSIGIKQDGTLWTWGYGSQGALGAGNFLQVTSSPVQIGSDLWIDCDVTTNLGATTTYACAAAIKNDGTLWTWGSNYNGALGDLTILPKSSPVQIGTTLNWKKVINREGGFYAITSENALYGWGYNLNGNIGAGGVISLSTPTFVSSFVEDVFSINNYTDPAVFIKMTVPVTDVIGTYRYRYFGNSNIWPDFSSVIRPLYYEIYKNYSFIGGNLSGFTAIDQEGKLWSWGNNAFGTIGNNTTISSTSPVQIMADRRFIKTSRTQSYTNFAIESDGSLWAWGSNFYGNLGDNSNYIISRSSPVQIGSLKNWTDITGSYTIFGFTSNDV